MLIFRHIFLSHYWFLYTFNIHLYMHIFRRIFLSNYSVITLAFEDDGPEIDFQQFKQF
jgi:hypothetical protein